jgi:hypothetical protein
MYVDPDAFDDELTPAQLAALAAMDGGYDPADLDPDDLDADLPEEWLALPPQERLAAPPPLASPGSTLTAGPGASQAAAGRGSPGAAPGASAARELFDAGFNHRYGGDGTGFAAGGPLDRMAAGPALAMAADRAWADGLRVLPDGALVGLMAAARRVASRHHALELATIGELSARRAGPDGCPGEHLEEEVAAALTLTGRAAAERVGLAGELARLPAVARALASGWIDLDKAEVFATQLLLLGLVAANQIAETVLPGAPGMTTGELRAALRKAINAYDPQALRRRQKEAEKDARVETWAEAAGTAALAGRDLPPAAALAADKTLSADARWLKARGAEGSMDQLRAAAFTARLTGQPLDTLLPSAPGTGADEASASDGTQGHGASTSAGPGSTPAPAPVVPPTPGWPAGPGSTVNLTMPAASWLGAADAPGQISGLDSADAWTCRDIASTLATQPTTRWCITLIGPNGQPVAHGCARAGPGPPGSDRRAWLATVTITPIETGTCTHRRESAGYQPSDSLRHIIKIRSPRCGAPGCRRPAVRCDDDHTTPYDKGGRTCECNLYPLCRLCRRRHKTHYADVLVMPMLRLEPLVAAGFVAGRSA